jgi:hypothetical protein
LRDDDNRELAKRHVLQALEEAPRFLAAHRLLLELSDPSPVGRGKGEGEAGTGAVLHPGPLPEGEGESPQ